MPAARSQSARLASTVAAALLVFAVWLLVNPRQNAGIAYFYAVPVGMATWWWGARAGAAAVLGCAGIYVFSDTIHAVENFGTALALRLLALCLVVAVIATMRERLLSLEHSAEELDVIRAALTPATLPELPDVDAAAAFVPSELGVSGDFYLLTNGPDGATLAIVGDVAGHGPRAARLATFVRAQLAAFAASTSDPGELLTLANSALLDERRRRQPLVSAICLRFGPEPGRCEWAAAGHPPPLHLPQLHELETGEETFLLGAREDLTLASAPHSLGGSEGLLLFTDGATDVLRRGDRLGLAGLVELLAPHAELGAEPLVREAAREILEWTDERVRDDLCILALKPRFAGHSA